MELKLRGQMAGMLKYMLAGIWLQCFLVGSLLATDGNTQQTGATLDRQQAVTVTGKVISDEDDQGLPGVNVIIKDTSHGTITDVNGDFKIDVPSPETVLVFSSVGYVKEEVVVGNRTVVNVTLSPDITSLEEVVVIGYGTTTKKEITGSVTTVKSDDFNKGDISNPMQLIQGRVPGLNITKVSGGNPNKGYQIQLRGLNTLSGGKSPLIIVDGIIGTNTLDMLDPNEIESIDVLKDGSAAAIYGTRATNGVILITTKKPKSGAVHYEYSTYLSTEIPAEQDRFLSASEYRDIVNQYYPDMSSSLDKGMSTDWFSEVTRTPLNQYHSLAATGGTDKINFRTDLYYKDDQGIIQNTSAKTVTPSLYVSSKGLNDRLKIDARLLYSYIRRKGGNNGVILQAINRNPTEPVYDPDDTEHGGYYTVTTSSGYNNPVATINEHDNLVEAQLFANDISASFSLMDGLNLIMHGSYNSQQNYSGDYQTRFYPNVGTNGNANVSTTYTHNILLEPGVEFKKSFNDHDIQAVAGYSYYYNEYKDLSANNYDFDLDDFSYHNIGSGYALTEGLAGMGTSQSSNKLIAFYGRVMYNYSEKYLLSTSVRYEGSSRFGANNKWGVFPAVSAGWRVTEEDFAKDLSWLSNLKLRAGYGVTGNQDIPNYQSISRISVSGRKMYYNGQWINTYRPSSNPNPDLKWEKKGEFDAGMDFGLWSSRITGTFDYYNRKISDLLWWYAVPVPPNVYPTTYANVGDIQNQGIELSLTGQIFKTNEASWSSTFIYSKNKNKLISFSDASQGYELDYLKINPIAASWSQLLLEGEPIGNFMAPVYQGVDEDGNAVYKDVNGDGKIDVESQDDREVVGNAYPKFELGWSNKINYKNFDLSFFFRGVFGQSLLNYERVFYENWRPLLSGGNILKSTLDNPDYQGIQTYDSRFVEKASYIKLNDVTLGYTVKFNKGNRLRVYLTGQNLLTITNYKGADPEQPISDFDTNIGPAGTENLNYYPYTRSFLMGLNFNF